MQSVGPCETQENVTWSSSSEGPTSGLLPSNPARTERAASRPSSGISQASRGSPSLPGNLPGFSQALSLGLFLGKTSSSGWGRRKETIRKVWEQTAAKRLTGPLASHHMELTRGSLVHCPGLQIQRDTPTALEPWLYSHLG